MFGNPWQRHVPLILGLVLISETTRADFVTNGSFEDPIVPEGFYTNFPAGSTAITGWTVVGVDSAVTSGTFTQNGIVFEAQDGKQYVDLAGITSNSKSSGVSQDIATTAGSVYQVSFYVGSATDNQFFFPSTVDLSIGGGPRVSYTNPTAPSDRLDWELFTAVFTATGPTTNLTFFNGDEPNNFVTALDNVSVRELSDPTAVPEPGAVVLLAIGVAGVMAGGRHGRRLRCPRGEAIVDVSP